VKRDVIYQWFYRGKMPEPLAVLKMGPVWGGPEFERWLRQQKRKKGAGNG
jgi:hypothetical protein